MGRTPDSDLFDWGSAVSPRAVLMALGRRLLQAGRAAEAGTALELAMSEPGRLPGLREILSELVTVYEQSGRNDMAFRTLIRCAEAWPDSQEDYLIRASGLLSPSIGPAMLQWLEAEWASRLSTEGIGEDVPALLLAADACLTAQMFDRANLYLKRAGNSKAPSALRSKVAERIYTVATTLNEQDKLTDARSILDSAVQVAPDYSPNRWLLVDIWRRLSYPELNKELVEKRLPVGAQEVQRSLEIWEEARRKDPEIDAWHLMERALLGEQLAKLEGLDRWRVGWESLVYCERTIIRRGFENSSDLVNLARCYRFLNLPLCEDYATRRALETSTAEERGVAIEARLITITNAGNFETAPELLKECREIKNSKWLDAVEGYMERRRDKTERALELINSGLESFDEPWCHSERASCYRELGRIREAIEEYKRLCDSCQSSLLDGLKYVTARHWLEVFGEVPSDGTIARMIQEYAARLALPLDSDYLVASGKSQLACGDFVRGWEILENGIRLVVTRLELNDLLRDLRYAALNHHDPQRREMIGKALSDPQRGIQVLASRRLAELETRPGGGDAELRELLRVRGEADAGGWLWVATKAGLGRIAAAEANHQEALNLYTQLASRSWERFPEADAAIEDAARRWVKLGRELLGKSDVHSAASVYQGITEFERVPAAVRADAWAGLAAIEAVTGNPAGASVVLHRAFECAAPAGGTESIGRLLRGHIFDQGSFWKVWDALHADAAKSGEGVGAALDLLPWFSERYELESQAEDQGRRQVILELGSALIPQIAYEKYLEWDLFKTYIPDLKKRFEERWGIEWPGVRVTENNNLASDAYTIGLDEVMLPLETGSVHVGFRFCTGPTARLLQAGIAREGLIEAYDPLTGKPGAWVPEAARAQVENAGLTMHESELQYVLLHVESVLTRNLANLLWLDEVESLLSKNDLSAQLNELVSKVLIGPQARFHFSRLLQSLVRQRVPLLRLFEMLEAINGYPLDCDSMDAAIRRVRQRLSSDLPGNSARWERVPLPGSLEERVHLILDRDQRAAEYCEVLLSELRHLTQSGTSDDSEGIALVASNWRVASFLSNLVDREPEFRHVAFLSQEEVREPLTAGAIPKFTVA